LTKAGSTMQSKLIVLEASETVSSASGQSSASGGVGERDASAAKRTVEPPPGVGVSYHSSHSAPHIDSPPPPVVAVPMSMLRARGRAQRWRNWLSHTLCCTPLRRRPSTRYSSSVAPVISPIGSVPASFIAMSSQLPPSLPFEPPPPSSSQADCPPSTALASGDSAKTSPQSKLDPPPSKQLSPPTLHKRGAFRDINDSLHLSGKSPEISSLRRFSAIIQSIPAFLSPKGPASPQKQVWEDSEELEEAAVELLGMFSPRTRGRVKRNSMAHKHAAQANIATPLENASINMQELQASPSSPWKPVSLPVQRSATQPLSSSSGQFHAPQRAVPTPAGTAVPHSIQFLRAVEVSLRGSPAPAGPSRRRHSLAIHVLAAARAMIDPVYDLSTLHQRGLRDKLRSEAIKRAALQASHSMSLEGDAPLSAFVESTGGPGSFKRRMSQSVGATPVGVPDFESLASAGHAASGGEDAERLTRTSSNASVPRHTAVRTVVHAPAATLARNVRSSNRHRPHSGHDAAPPQQAAVETRGQVLPPLATPAGYLVTVHPMASHSSQDEQSGVIPTNLSITMHNAAGGLYNDAEDTATTATSPAPSTPDIVSAYASSSLSSKAFDSSFTNTPKLLSPQLQVRKRAADVSLSPQRYARKQLVPSSPHPANSLDAASVVSVVRAFAAQGDTELSIVPGDEVRPISGHCGGWTQVEAVSRRPVPASELFGDCQEEYKQHVESGLLQWVPLESISRLWRVAFEMCTYDEPGGDLCARSASKTKNAVATPGAKEGALDRLRTRAGPLSVDTGTSAGGVDPGVRGFLPPTKSDGDSQPVVGGDTATVALKPADETHQASCVGWVCVVAGRKHGHGWVPTDCLPEGSKRVSGRGALEDEPDCLLGIWQVEINADAISWVKLEDKSGRVVHASDPFAVFKPLRSQQPSSGSTDIVAGSTQRLAQQLYRVRSSSSMDTITAAENMPDVMPQDSFGTQVVLESSSRSLVPSGMSTSMTDEGSPFLHAIYTKATHNFQGQGDAEIDLHRGDVIVVWNQDPTGWWEGRNMRTGIEGWFPSTYVGDFSGLVESTAARLQGIRFNQ